jgi:hypothetical protein
MSMDRVVRCSRPECREPATYKVAALWSDRRFPELKTYGFACADHVEDVFRDAEARWLAYQPDPDERLQEVGIYCFEPGRSDHDLERDRALEESLRRDRRPAQEACRTIIS